MPFVQVWMPQNKAAGVKAKGAKGEKAKGGALGKGGKANYIGKGANECIPHPN